MESIRARVLMFTQSAIAARLLAKLGALSLQDIPTSLPEKERENFYKSVKRTLKKTEKEGLPWVQVSEDKWVAKPTLEEVERDGSAGDIFFLVDSLKRSESGNHHVQNIACEQCIIILFAQLDALLQDIVTEVCKKENRILSCKKQITWYDVVDSSGYSELIDKLIGSFVFEFGYKNLPEKLGILDDKLGLKIALPKELLDNIFLAEQARHLFTHTGGRVSREFIERTKAKTYDVGDRIVLDYGYCVNLSDGVICLANAIASSAIRKYWSEYEEKDGRGMK